MDIQEAGIIVEQLKRDFEIFKDKVGVLETLCNSYKLTAESASRQSEGYKLILKKVAHFAKENSYIKITELLEDVEL